MPDDELPAAQPLPTLPNRSAPEFRFFGEISNAAIEALAALLLSIADANQPEQAEVRS
jgi:hypothetical protein